MNTECEKFEAKLTPYLLGDLPEEEMRAVEAHLECCGTCRALLPRLRSTLELLHGALAAAPEAPRQLSPERRELVAADQERQAAAMEKKEGLLVQWFTTRHTWLTRAAIAIVFVIGMVVIVLPMFSSLFAPESKSPSAATGNADAQPFDDYLTDLHAVDGTTPVEVVAANGRYDSEDALFFFREERSEAKVLEQSTLNGPLSDARRMLKDLDETQARKASQVADQEHVVEEVEKLVEDETAAGEVSFGGRTLARTDKLTAAPEKGRDLSVKRKVVRNFGVTGTSGFGDGIGGGQGGNGGGGAVDRPGTASTEKGYFSGGKPAEPAAPAPSPVVPSGAAAESPKSAEASEPGLLAFRYSQPDGGKELRSGEEALKQRGGKPGGVAGDLEKRLEAFRNTDGWKAGKKTEAWYDANDELDAVAPAPDNQPAPGVKKPSLRPKPVPKAVPVPEPSPEPSLRREPKPAAGPAPSAPPPMDPADYKRPFLGNDAPGRGLETPRTDDRKEEEHRPSPFAAEEELKTFRKLQAGSGADPNATASTEDLRLSAHIREGKDRDAKDDLERGFDTAPAPVEGQARANQRFFERLSEDTGTREPTLETARKVPPRRPVVTRSTREVEPRYREKRNKHPGPLPELREMLERQQAGQGQAQQKKESTYRNGETPEAPDKEAKAKSKPSILGDIPLIGRLFNGKGKSSRSAAPMQQEAADNNSNLARTAAPAPVSDPIVVTKSRATSEDEPAVVEFRGAVDVSGSMTIPGEGAGVAESLLKSGLSPLANQRDVRLRRTVDGREQEIHLDVKSILDTGDFSNDIPLQPGDVVEVPSSTLNLPMALETAKAAKPAKTPVVSGTLMDAPDDVITESLGTRLGGSALWDRTQNDDYDERGRPWRDGLKHEGSERGSKSATTTPGFDPSLNGVAKGDKAAVANESERMDALLTKLKHLDRASGEGRADGELEDRIDAFELAQRMKEKDVRGLPFEYKNASGDDADGDGNGRVLSADYARYSLSSVSPDLSYEADGTNLSITSENGTSGPVTLYTIPDAVTWQTTTDRFERDQQSWVLRAVPEGSPEAQLPLHAYFASAAQVTESLKSEGIEYDVDLGTGGVLIVPGKPDEVKLRKELAEVARPITATFTEKPEETKPVFRASHFNPWVATAENRWSTFSIDADSAAYTLARRYILDQSLPPPEAVRTEEFVNFFNYQYASPKAGTFAVYAEAAPAPFGAGHLMKIGVKGKVIGRDQQRPARLTFCIDASGSMDKPDRMGLIRRSLKLLVEQLGEQDEVAIVYYGSRAHLLLEHTSDKQAILDAVDSIKTGGSTHLENGLILAYETASKTFDSRGVNRVLLLSDGAANLGSGKAEEILGKVDGYKDQGIFCSVFGFGIGTYDDVMLETLANKGNGSYQYVDSEEEAKRIFVQDLSATLNTIASDVKIQVEFNPERVKEYRQLGYENRQLTKEQFRDDTVDAGEVGSGQAVTALYEMDLKGDPEAELGVVRVRFRDLETGQVEEMEQPLTAAMILGSFDQADARFQLAAGVAEFAEILRGSPYADGGDYAEVGKALRAVALELHMDEHVQELVRMVQAAPGLPRAPE